MHVLKKLVYGIKLWYSVSPLPQGKLILIIQKGHRACTIRFMVILTIQNCHPGNLSLGTVEVFQALEVVRMT